MPEWLSITLAITGGTGILALIVKDIYGWLKNKTKAAKARIKAEKQSEMSEVIQKEMAPVKEELVEIKEQLEHNTKGTVTAIRCSLKKDFNDCRAKGYASVSDKANWHDLYNDYKELGGNHFKEYVDEWKKGMEDLPVEPKSTKERKPKSKSSKGKKLLVE